MSTCLQNLYTILKTIPIVNKYTLSLEYLLPKGPIINLSLLLHRLIHNSDLSSYSSFSIKTLVASKPLWDEKFLLFSMCSLSLSVPFQPEDPQGDCGPCRMTFANVVGRFKSRKMVSTFIVNTGDVQFKVDPEQQNFWKNFSWIFFFFLVFARNLLRGSCRKNIYSYFLWKLWSHEQGRSCPPHKIERIRTRPWAPSRV